MDPRSSKIRPQVATLLWLAVTVVGIAGHAGVPGEGQPAEPFPVGEKLVYRVSWMGIKCGHMEISSFVEHKADTPHVYRIVLFARTTKFFDGIYKVRSRLDSYVDPVRMASFRYEEHAVEKKKRKDDVWLFDHESGEALREEDGKVTRIPIGGEKPLDPLAFVYRLRSIEPEVGNELALELMTKKGAVETVSRTTEVKKVKTKMGRCDAVAVVPEPRDKMMFSKSGSMVVWIDNNSPRRPCRIEFDLSFGKLVASLSDIEDAAGKDVRPPWQQEEER